MGWAEDRIEGYRRGRPASRLGRRMLEHADPVHLALALAAGVGFVSGLWAHAWFWIIASAALALLGHLYCWTWGRVRPRREARTPEGGAAAVKAG